MKKTLAILMAIILVFSLVACKSDSTDLSSGGAPESTFNAPDNYAVVLLASINPKIKLYIDANKIVLALEPVNNDAKQIINDIPFENIDYQTVIKSFVSVANSKGFISGDAKINFEITDIKDTSLNANDILQNASAAASQAASGNKISLSTTVTDEPIATNPTSSENNDDNNDNNNNNKVPSTNDPAKDHKHSYSKATCTKPATCSCGATQGSTAAHNWNAATCKAPKTCSVCGATEGSKGQHTYSGGKCTVCGLSNTLNPKKDLKTDVEYVGNLKVVDGELVGGALYFDGEVCVIGDRYFSPVQEDPDQQPIIFEGKKYYSQGVGQNPHNFELTDTEVIIKGCLWADDPNEITIKFTLQGDGMLKATYSKNSSYPVGAVFSSNINDVLK